ncbi:hypothetical protein ABES25_06110 [Bacillus gobiensis]|uniref:hypothetical protein n=1 Tax=Bacillus gobiensis TaxID=1441095 RepID=UPI003D1A6824
MKVLGITTNDTSELNSMFQSTVNDYRPAQMAIGFKSVLEDRGLRVTMDEYNFARASFMAWSYNSPLMRPIAWSAPAGFGKSTMLEQWAIYNGTASDVLWGGIIVKPKREHVEEYCKNVNEAVGGKLIAQPLLGKTNEMTEKEYKSQFDNQEFAPLLVMTHKMFEIIVSQNKLNEYSTWIDTRGNSRRRTQLIIDERPRFVETPKLTITKIEKLTELVRMVSMASNGFHKEYVQLIEKEAEKLKKELKRHIEKDGRTTFKVQAINPLFEVPKVLMYDWMANTDLLGMDYNLLGTFTEAIQRGGTAESNKNGVGIYVGRVIWQKLTSMNTHVLDASAIGDVSYEVTPFNMLAPVIPEGAYSNIIIRNCFEHNIGQSFFDTHKEGFKKTVGLAKIVAKEHKKLLVVVYKDLFKKYQRELAEVDNIVLKYFDDERSSNAYSDCDGILFLGLHRQSPAYYIETAKAIFGDDFSDDFNNRGGMNFEEQDVQRVYLSEIRANRYQGIGRARGYKSTVKKVIYMFSMDKEITEELLEDMKGATLEKWVLPFSLTGKEKKETSKDNYIQFLRAGRFKKVKCSHVYKNVLKISRSQWNKIKEDPEVTAAMAELGHYYEKNSLIEGV